MAKGALTTKSVKNGTTIVRCTCFHEFQDATYGRFMRVHNGSSKGPRCTVCLKEK